MMTNARSAAADLRPVALESPWPAQAAGFALAQIVLGEEDRIISANDTALRTGFPGVGEQLTSDDPLSQGARTLARALAHAVAVEALPVRDELRDRHWVLTGEVIRRAPLLVRVYTVDASVAVHEERRMLLRGLVHGLRNASFSLDALLSTVDLSSLEDVQQMVPYLRAPVAWLQHLASGLGRMIERAALERRVIAVGDLVRLTLARTRHRLSGRLTSSVSQAVNALAIDADAEQLSSALAAIVDNAARHGPADQPIEIEARRVDGHAPGIELAVRDGGETLPITLMPAIWAPMVHVRPRNVGLGLSIVRDVVRAHGGEVFAERPANGGTRIGMRLPLSI